MHTSLTAAISAPWFLLPCRSNHNQTRPLLVMLECSLVLLIQLSTYLSPFTTSSADAWPCPITLSGSPAAWHHELDSEDLFPPPFLVAFDYTPTLSALMSSNLFQLAFCSFACEKVITLVGCNKVVKYLGFATDIEALEQRQVLHSLYFRHSWSCKSQWLSKFSDETKSVCAGLK